jgi:hypothetical protein
MQSNMPMKMSTEQQAKMSKQMCNSKDMPMMQHARHDMQSMMKK